MKASTRYEVELFYKTKIVYVFVEFNILQDKSMVFNISNMLLLFASYVCTIPLV